MAAPQVTSLTLSTPAGTLDGDLMVCAIGLTYTPVGLGAPCPGAAPSITPAAGWSTMLADFPGGENALGAGECDRMAVYFKVAAAEPPTHTFSWVPDGAVSAVGLIKTFIAVDPGSPVNVSAATALIVPDAVNPMAVVAPSVTPTQPNTLLCCVYVARNGTEGAPGGSLFSIPAGMADMTPALNFVTTLPPTDPLGIAMFSEVIPGTAATGTRTSVVTQNRVPPNPLQGMGYSFCVAGICGG